MRRNTFKILFYIKKNAVKSNGKAPVMARVTLNSEIAQFSLKCEVNPAEWSPKAGRATGKGVGRDILQKYQRTGTRLKDFMKYKYKISDINLKEII
ncbi:Arm DNA-binding domain-containing protein [Viscerimonas tarda]